MRIAEATEDLALILSLVVLVAGIVAAVWYAYGSRAGRGASIAAWLGLVTLTLGVGWVAAFVLLHVLLFTLGTWAAIAGALVTNVLMVLMPFGWAVIVRRRGRPTTGLRTH
jgi:hypothetical protein